MNYSAYDIFMINIRTRLQACSSRKRSSSSNVDIGDPGVANNHQLVQSCRLNHGFITTSIGSNELQCIRHFCEKQEKQAASLLQQKCL